MLTLRNGRFVFCFACLLTVICQSVGCRLPGGDGPVSQSVFTCRQLLQQGLSAIDAGQWGRAEKLLLDAVHTCPEDPDARRHYAEALWHRGAQREALKQMYEVAQFAEGDASAHVRIAEMELEMGRVSIARRHAELAVDLDPKASESWTVRGRINWAEGRSREALADFHRALGYNPTDRDVMFAIAELHRRLNEPQKALIALQSLADSYSPGEEPQMVAYLQGLALKAVGRHDDAIQRFSEAVDAGRGTADMLFHLAEAEMLSGRLIRAAETLQRVIDLDPDHGPSKELAGRLRLASRKRAGLK